MKSCNKALIIYEKEDNESMSCAFCLDIIGNVYREQTKYNEALKCYKRELMID